MAPEGGTRPSRIGETESQALGNLQDPTGPISGTVFQEAPRRQRPSSPAGLTARASPGAGSSSLLPVLGSHGDPWAALPQGPRAQNERDGQTEARHKGSEKGLQDRCPGHALWSMPPLRQINLVTATNYQKETGTLSFLPPILPDKIRDWVSVCGTTRIFRPEP